MEIIPQHVLDRFVGFARAHNDRFRTGRSVIAVDARDRAAAKRFADLLHAGFDALGVVSVTADIAGFELPRRGEWRLDRVRGQGFEELVDEPELRMSLIEPFRFGNSAGFTLAIYDPVTGVRLPLAWRTTPAHSVLIVHGSFLLREPLLKYWDTSFAISTVSEIERNDWPFDAPGDDMQWQRYQERWKPDSHAQFIVPERHV